MKLGPIHIITNKKRKQLIKHAKQELYKQLMTNSKSKNTVLKSELGIE